MGGRGGRMVGREGEGEEAGRHIGNGGEGEGEREAYWEGRRK